MNYWTDQSIELATQTDYLDQLFRVYPLESEVTKRELNSTKVDQLSTLFEAGANEELLRVLLQFEKFPINDSYVSLCSHPGIQAKDLMTIYHMAKKLRQLGVKKFLERNISFKGRNTQIRSMFKWWLAINPIGTRIFTNTDDFIDSTEDGFLLATDPMMKQAALRLCNYNHQKFPDFLGRFNKKMVIGVAGFITKKGKNQRKQLLATCQMLDDDSIKAIRIAILDGLIFLPTHKNLLGLVTDNNSPHYVLSALLLNTFLYSL